MIRSWDFNSKDFGRCIDWLQLAAQSLFRISGHPEVTFYCHYNNDHNKSIIIRIHDNYFLGKIYM